MGVSLGFLFVMVVVGGFVAYLGDSIGRKIGKKRLKIWRLRPMHTAMIGTFVAGMLGTLATILVLAAVAEPVRVWILEGDKARADVSRLQKQVSDLEDQRDESKSLVDAQKKTIDSGQSKIAETSKTLEQRQKDLASAQAESKRLLAQRGELTTRVALIQKRVATIQGANDKLQKEGRELDKQIKESRSGLQITREDNVKLQRMNADLTTDNTKLEDQINENNRQIEQLEAVIEQSNKTLENLTTENRKKLQEYIDSLNAAKSELETTNIELEKRKQENANIAKALQANFQNRFQPLIFNFGDELARIRVPGQTSRNEVVGLMDQVVRSASEVARSRGATRSPSGTYVDLLGIMGSFVDENLRAKEEELIRKITAQPRDYVLIVSAFANSFKEEPATIALDFKPNPLVYKSGDIVLEMQIDGTLNEDFIIDQIFNYLQENLPKTAIGKGMIPARGQEAPLGEVTRDQILQMADRVRQSGRRVRLQILAAGDTRAGDKLRIDFRLRI